MFPIFLWFTLQFLELPRGPWEPWVFLGVLCAIWRPWGGFGRILGEVSARLEVAQATWKPNSAIPGKMPECKMHIYVLFVFIKGSFVVDGHKLGGVFFRISKVRTFQERAHFVAGPGGSIGILQSLCDRDLFWKTLANCDTLVVPPD